MKLLAIDPATSCGWAYWDGYQLISGVWDLRVLRDESAGFRLIRLRSKLRQVGPVSMLLFEAAGFTRFRAAAQVAGQIEGVLLTWAEDNDVPLKSVKPGELKKFATGKGSANKTKMIAAAKEKTGYEGDNDNEADARLIALLGVERYGDSVEHGRIRNYLLKDVVRTPVTRKSGRKV